MSDKENKRKLRLKRIIKVKDLFLVIILISICISIGIIFYLTPFSSGKDGKLAEYYFKNNANETASANLVTSVLVSYRAFDTLGEVTVLFLAATGVGVMLSMRRKEEDVVEIKNKNFILDIASRILFPILLLYGIYIIVHGHLSPGGGFQGGVVIASAFLLLYLADKKFRVNNKIIAFLESLSGSAFVIIGLIGLFLAFTSSFLANFLTVDAKDIGLLLSAGIIPIVYIFVGIKVGSELTGLIQNMLKNR